MNVISNDYFEDVPSHKTEQIRKGRYRLYTFLPANADTNVTPLAKGRRHNTRRQSELDVHHLSTMTDATDTADRQVLTEISDQCIITVTELKA
jgi:hypothetical protein